METFCWMFLLVEEQCLEQANVPKQMDPPNSAPFHHPHVGFLLTRWVLKLKHHCHLLKLLHPEHHLRQPLHLELWLQPPVENLIHQKDFSWSNVPACRGQTHFLSIRQRKFHIWCHHLHKDVLVASRSPHHNKSKSFSLESPCKNMVKGEELQHWPIHPCTRSTKIKSLLVQNGFLAISTLNVLVKTILYLKISSNLN